MTKLIYDNSAKLCLLNEEEVQKIHATALQILSEVGVLFECEEALDYLEAAGCRVERQKKIVTYPEELVLAAIQSVPEKFWLYNRSGQQKIEIGGNHLEITPTFSASDMLSDQERSTRPATIADLKDIISLTNQMDAYHIAIPAVVCEDIPPQYGDFYRDYMILKYSDLPMITEVWSIESLLYLNRLLLAVRGSQEALTEKPLTIVGLCPMAPLVWSKEAAQNLIQAVRWGLPVNICACPMLGSGSPITIAGSVAQQVAEFLSGLVLAQTIKKGAPVVFGGYSTSMDMRTMAAVQSAMEAMMAVSAHATMAKFYGVPSQTFAESADAKILDYQCGWETALTGVIAVLSGINLIYGCGSLDDLLEFSYEKFLLDAELANYFYFLHQGISVDEESLALDVIKEVGPQNSFMMTMHTMMGFRQAQCCAAKFVDRNKREAWQSQGKLDASQAVRPFVETLLANETLQPATEEMCQALDQVILDINQEAQVDLPLA